MIPLIANRLTNLLGLVKNGMPEASAIEQAIGGCTVQDGLWRVFSNSWPNGGSKAWNSNSGWRSAWKGFLPEDIFCIGEDVFGNQLALVSGRKNVLLVDHESAECVDLELDVCDLFAATIESGLDWLDFYANGSLDVARRQGNIPDDSHIHWLTPLIVGGQVCLENTTLVERESHLIGHGKLWSQIYDLPTGSSVNIKR